MEPFSVMISWVFLLHEWIEWEGRCLNIKTVEFGLYIIFFDRCGHLCHHLWSKRTHIEFEVLAHSTLSHLQLLRWEHPFFVWEHVVLSVNHKSHISELSMRLAWHNRVRCWNFVLLKLGSAPSWEWHQRGSRIECDKTFPSLAHI